MTTADDPALYDRAAKAAPDWRLAMAAAAFFALGDPFIQINKTFGGDDPAPWIRYVWLTSYIVFAPLLLAHWRLVPGAVVRTPVLMALAILALVSALWSILPDVSARRAIGVLYWLVLAGVLASILSWRAIIRALAWAFLWLSIGSYIMALVWPTIGRMEVEHPGAWSGLWTHKNQLGGHMAMAVLVFAAAIWTDAARRGLWSIGLVLALILIALSTSATAFVSAVLALGVIAFVGLLRAGVIAATVTMAAAASLALVFVGLAAIAPDILFGLIGRDATFTGRTEIWRYVNDAIAERPWFGWGYGAFWVDETGPAWWVRAGAGWKVPSAHNGWVDLTLSLGQVGVALFALSFALTAGRALAALGNRDAALFAPGFMLLYLIQTLGEGYVLEDNNLLSMLFALVASKLAMRRRLPP